MKVIPPDLAPGSRLLLVGERPGADEHDTDDDDPYRNFVGPAGQELWARLWDTCHLTRDAFTVCNLVPVFSVEPPTPAEVHAHRWRLDRLLHTVRPRLVVTVGYHAARALLPQFKDTNGDYFHGLPHQMEYGKLRPRTCPLVPVVHSSAALRQPDRYQSQLTADLRAVADTLESLGRPGRPAIHAAHVLDPYRSGLAGLMHAPLLGLDCEWGPDRVEAVTLSMQHPTRADLSNDCCIEPDRSTRLPLKRVIESAAAVVIHHAIGDWVQLGKMRISLNGVRVHDTMLQAYLLGLPQSLKVLAYRLLGLQMQEYTDLVQPLDDTLVRTTLKEFHDAQKDTIDRQKQEAAHAKKSRRRHREDHGQAERPDGRPDAARRSDARAPQGTDSRGDRRGDAAGTPERPAATGRALSSLRRILTSDADKSPRARWQASTFTALVTLPPAPTWKDLPEPDRVRYALTDAVAHRRAHEALYPMLKARGLLRVYEMDRGVLPFLARNARVGLKVDTEELPRLTKKFTRELQVVVDRLEEIVGHPVNPSAPDEVSQMLFDELDVTPTRRGKSGNRTTQKKYLKTREHEHEAVSLVMEGRHLIKLRGTYTERLPGMLVDGRYHPDWKYTRTLTGRAAEAIILLIPKDSPYAKLVRNCFVADDGHALVANDLSQIELRTFAHDSRDERMCRAFMRGEDLHANTAHDLLGAPKGKENQDDARHRKPSKILNFSMIMGTTEYGLYDQFKANKLPGWTLESTAEFIRAWFRRYAGGKAYLEACKAEARRFGYVTNMFGRRIACDGINSIDARIRVEFERKAHATKIQSSASDISKMWIKQIWRRVILPRMREGRRYCEPWVWVHDDVTLEVDRRIKRQVKEECLALVPDVLRIPTLAEAKIGARWGMLH